MARAKLVKAQKDYPQFGISKGDQHYVWSMKMQRGGVTRRSMTQPRSSQLTLSPFKSQAHAINETLGDQIESAASPEDLKTAAEEAASEAEGLRDETQESLDAMPEGLQQGGTGELLQERVEALESFIGEMEDFEPDEPNQDDPDFDEDERMSEWSDVLRGIELEVN